MQKKKIINFRPLFYCFISYGFAIVFARKLFYEHFAYIIVFSLLVLLGFLLAYHKKKFLEFSVCAVAVLLGISSFFITVNKYIKTTTYDTPVVISGNVANIKEYNQGQQLVLNNLKIDNVKQNFSISLFNFEEDFSMGDYLEIQTDLSKITLFNLGKFSSYYYNNKVFYTSTYSSASLITHKKANLSFKERIKQSTLNSFLTVMPKDIANIAYGAMFGDTSGISNDISASFRNSGIIHILSVSGLHIMIVVGIVDFLLRKIKMNKYLRFSIFASVLIFYSYLCSFNITVTRACLMSLILILGTTFGKRYDMLSALGLSGLLLLFFKPLMIFDIGFQLSFLSVFMIASFAKPLSNFFQKRHLNKNISNALAISISVQVGLFPLMLKYFGQFPLLGTFANLIAVPVFELGFVLAFVLNIFVLILPFLSFLLFPISFLFILTVKISNFFASLNFLIFYGYLPSEIILLFFLFIVFIFSPFVMLAKKFKRPMILLLALLCFVFCLVDLKPKQYQNFNVFQASYNNSNTTIFIANKETVLISDFKDINYLTLYLSHAKINNFDIVLPARNFNQENFNAFKQNFEVKTILLPEQDFESDTIKISSLTLLSGKNLPVINIFGYRSLILTNTLTLYEENNLSLINNSFNFNIVVDWHKSNLDFNADYILNKNTLSTPNLQYKQLNNWYFALKNGKIDYVRSLN